MSAAKPNLIYTIAFDAPGYALAQRAMAKLLASSLLRTFFDGEILIFRNSPAPIFAIERERVDEIYIEIPESVGEREFLLHSCEFKFRSARYIDASRYGKILYADADCLAMGYADDLFAGGLAIRYLPEPGMPVSSHQFNTFLSDEEMASGKTGINAGVFMVEGEEYAAVMAEFERLHGAEPARGGRPWSDQPAWNRLILDGKFSAAPFDPGEVAFPAAFHPRFQEWRRAPLCHFCGEMDVPMKLEFMLGAYAMRFLGDATPLVADLLEA